ncbi:MAG TPA: ThiF family adenylyltransferase [Nitrososphaera sp.]|nr:ThiF family adenylyltransferase [Nitrososphaera sp.]
MVIIGAGGIGSWLAPAVARLLEYREQGSALFIVDGDSFEPKNKERQNFSRLGNKAQVLAYELQPQFDHTVIIPMPNWIVDQLPKDEGDGEDDAAEDEDEVTPGRPLAIRSLLQEDDVVFAVVDNFSARKVIFDAAKDYKNIDVLTGGNDDQLFGSTYHYQRRDGRDVTDHPAEYHEELLNPPDRNPGELSCQERAELEGGTQLLATNMAVAAWLLARVHHVIFEDNEPAPQAEIMFDLGEGRAAAHDRAAEAVPVATVKGG